MKSNQERSNECLPPKKREIPASNLPTEEKPAAVASACESLRGENLAWLASVATTSESDGPLYKPLSASSSSSSSSSSSQSRAPVPGPTAMSLPTVYTSAVSQPSGAIQYAQLPPNLHFVSPQYTTPYTTSYMSPAAPVQRPHLDTYSKVEQQHSLGRPQSLPPAEGTLSPHASQAASQYVQVASSPRGSLPLHLHSHSVVPQALALAAHSQVLLQYSDGPVAKKEEGRAREVLNGELEKSRRYSLPPESTLGKQGGGAKGTSSQQHQHQQQHYEARHIVLPADYTQDTSGLRTSLMLVPNSHTSADSGSTPDRPPAPAAPAKPVSQTSSSSFAFPPPQSDPKAPTATLSPHTVIQTTHSAPEQLSLGLPSASFYPAPTQPPIIGYIAGSGQQQHVGYHAALPQHLLIPGSQPIIIPVSGGRGAGPDAGQTAAAAATASQQFPGTPPQAFVATAPPKCESFEHTAPPYHTAAVVQAQLHLPLVPASPPAPSSPSLPPYFVKGSIIQLADGALKRVEELKTEDFIQSAEISSELKIDSSTVERIEGSQAPNFAIIQFAVGENRTQVSVEVLVEYPFFVFGQGWSSCCPERTTQLLELPCSRLSVGDVCISLTLKNLRNGSLKKGQSLDSASGAGLPFKPPKVAGIHGEQENGLGQRPGAAISLQATSANGDLKLEEKTSSRPPPPRTESSGTSKPTSRKRRWSAPEGRKVEKADEEAPLTLPRPSFIPQEVKISIEGRSNIGK
ncbi:ataxin-1a [Scleropages formosus]|uniref:Ataxin 1 n=1 Tax=Scleropages formosus TaxID=113540 RepID=A0A8C9R2M5_SCLFO|nr:ataxin-1 [Scleropages formosus]XP_018582695.2 ataxin-1 [Scleropages formosus]XP_018582696.2 ataxin-1 [Scleropages formosus]XP_018582697.2 ataxin-1 [Scleropages formosus]XP_018582698.2 ataxin-1 [Scleropages formosus]XP_018582699.2 ataxin-1 [Scleropages formosus]XP_018582701.2 ataxin-1 [Scleropages formosus]XP_018582702.2 ataxin-1 [Scleropages formosus]XP_018582703.2 ataxin-1 [Scleropages formosus]